MIFWRQEEDQITKPMYVTWKTWSMTEKNKEAAAQGCS